MPGRLSIFDDSTFKADIAQTLGSFKDDVQTLVPNYNIAPTIEVPILTNTMRYTTAHFGLIPSWAKGRSQMQINARCESVFEKVTFKEAYKSRRCIIMVNGYYEWVKDVRSKISVPYFIHANTGDYFAFAGVYEEWYDNALGSTILSCALLTTNPNDFIAPIHDRMPVILAKEDWDTWLDAKSDYTTLNTLYTPYPSDKMQMHEVSQEVNSVKNNGKSCIEEASLQTPRQASLFE
ncbi:MAG: Putative SOS response-associated peptidase [uncultured Sulfurovum sp.]|uniref:Abasic site processing protein n=1 Tax=uncultured Sulfurovum sp. TaxID=269237 RepID=A0A6S6U2I3_9BACT|nr:MAG: Putative SOS response-associated peptidase [uncultured Sulfurovum sp.]